MYSTVILHTTPYTYVTRFNVYHTAQTVYTICILWTWSYFSRVTTLGGPRQVGSIAVIINGKLFVCLSKPAVAIYQILAFSANCIREILVYKLVLAIIITKY